MQIRFAWYLLGNVQEVNMVKPCQDSPSNWSLLWISFISLALGGHKIWRKQCEASRATNRHVFLFFASFRQIDVCIQKVSNHRITSKWRKMVTLIGFLQENILKIQSLFFLKVSFRSDGFVSCRLDLLGKRNLWTKTTAWHI